MDAAPRTFVYVDGFNLYNGLKRRAKNKGVPATEYRWLDLLKLARALMPDSEVVCVKYFTSTVKRRSDDDKGGERQDTFLAALRTIPEVKIEKGIFQRNYVSRELVNERGTFAYVIDYKEKRSDVNLAARLLEDAYEGHCERAAIISADSDLVTPVEIAKRVLPHGVYVLNPNLQDTARHLDRVATRAIWITENDLRGSQLPPRLSGPRGRVIQRPPDW
jgi:hypothetical protein